MAKPIDKNAVAKKMFDEGEPDDLLIEPERSSKRVTIREEAGVSLIKRRSPAQFIPLASIVKRSASQVRMSDFNPEKYPEDKCLLESIRNRGVVTPVMVKEFIEDDDDLLADTRYELIYGHRRVSACKVLGFTTIPAFVVESTVSSADVTMTENIGVRTLNAYERGREFDSYLSSHSISLRAFSEQNGFPHPYVIELIRAYNLERKVIAEYAAPYQVTGYEYEVMAVMDAMRSGLIECYQLPHETILHTMRMMDNLRAAFGIVYPFELDPESSPTEIGEEAEKEKEIQRESTVKEISNTANNQTEEAEEEPAEESNEERNGEMNEE